MLVKTAIIEFFRKKGIADIFHLPGIHTLPLNEVLSKQNINIFIGRHEASVVFMADGYYRSSGRIGVVIVTPGPGLGNVVSGCMEAYSDDVPLMIIHVDIDREGIGRGRLHELNDPNCIFKNITKGIFSISNHKQTLSVLNEAYNKAFSERKGTVIVSIPYTFFEKELPQGSNYETEQHHFGLLRKECIWEGSFEQALFEKTRPVIVGGRGLMFQEARSFIEDICIGSSIPFLTTTDGKGVVREDATYAFGNIMQRGIVREIIDTCDIVIAIGTRLREADAVRRGVKIKELIHIDIDDRWMDKNYKAKLKITGDIRYLLKDLCNIMKKRRYEWDLKGLKERQIKEFGLLRKSFYGFRIVETLRRAIPEETSLVCELNYPSYWAEYYFPVYAQNSFLMPRGVSPVFCALPESIGAKIGKPDRPCLCIVGDGGILPTISELSTIIKYNIPIVVMVHNNGGFGILETVMADRYGIGGSMLLKNPDFVKLAHAFGIKAKRTKTVEGLKNIMLREISWDEPFLIEFKSPVLPPPWLCEI